MSAAWKFYSLRHGFEKTTDLWLYPELDGSSVVDDIHGEPPEDQLAYYVEYVKSSHPDRWNEDRVPIYWSVQPVCEFAPYGLLAWGEKREFFKEDFLSFYSWPRSASTGDLLDWFDLPVKYSRFPEFGDALKWKPSPLQPFAPLRSIMECRSGFYRYLTRDERS